MRRSYACYHGYLRFRVLRLYYFPRKIQLGRKNSPQVCLTEDDHVIQALTSQRADQTFSDTILPG